MIIISPYESGSLDWWAAFNEKSTRCERCHVPITFKIEERGKYQRIQSSCGYRLGWNCPHCGQFQSVFEHDLAKKNYAHQDGDFSKLCNNPLCRCHE